MSRSASLPPDYFERMFAADSDPWGFETSAYEAAKYDVTIAALDARTYGTGFEVGCANGVLTKRLARRCDALLAIDVSTSALMRARAQRIPAVTFAEMTFPAQHPPDMFDLIVMSEVVYYWNADDISKAAEFVDRHLNPRGDLLLVHWTGDTDYPHSGDAAVSLMRDGLPLFETLRAERHEKYRLDLWRKP